MIRITGLNLPLDHSENDLKSAICKLLGVNSVDLISFSILKRSLDARKNRPLLWVYSLLVEVVNENSLSNKIAAVNTISLAAEQNYESPLLKKDRVADRPLVVGTGPAGLFAGLILAEAGLNPILLERGKPVQERIRDVNQFWKGRQLDPESNVQFGEGGAGTFSDGKLNTRVKDQFNRAKKIKQEMVNAGAPEEILYTSKPHIGTANLVKVVQRLRKKIEDLGGEYRFESLVQDLICTDDRILGVMLANGEEVRSSLVVLAIGHSSRDTFNMLHNRGLQLAPKPFSVGFRIEHPQSLIDQNQFGEYAGHPSLGAAEYQLAYHTSLGRTVYSFCMCPGGTVVGASSEHHTVVTNGMSQYARDLTNANSAIVAEVFPSDFDSDPLGGFRFQRFWEENAFRLGGENYNAPVQLVGDFMSGKPSRQMEDVIPTYLPGVTPGDLRNALPPEVIKAILEALPIFERKIHGFAMSDAVLTGVETRTSSPLRILRGKNYQSITLNGLYPVGEGSGYAGGIISSAIDGIKAAEFIVHEINEDY